MRCLLLDRWVITPCQELAVTKRLGQRQSAPIRRYHIELGEVWEGVTHLSPSCHIVTTVIPNTSLRCRTGPVPDCPDEHWERTLEMAGPDPGSRTLLIWRRDRAL